MHLPGCLLLLSVLCGAHCVFSASAGDQVQNVGFSGDSVSDRGEQRQRLHVGQVSEEASHLPEALLPSRRFRMLQQQVEQQETLVVTKPVQLMGAIEQRARHIEVQEHLDLTTVLPRGKVGLAAMLVDDFRDKVDFANSIRGNCSTEPSAEALKLSGAPLSDWKPGQCVIVTDVGLLEMSVNLWVDNLYIRHHATTRSDTISLIWCGMPNCHLWITSSHIQGQGVQDIDPGWGAIVVTSGTLFAQDLAISDFVSEASLFVIDGGGVAELNSCTLSRNKITGMEQVALIEAHGPSTTGVGQGLSQDTAIILRQLKIIGSTAPHNLLIYSHDQNDFGAAIYSDEPLDVHVLSGEAGNRTTLPLEDLPSDTKRINASSAWFRSTQQETQQSNKIAASDSRTSAISRSTDVSIETHSSTQGNGESDTRRDPNAAGIHVALISVGVLASVLLLAVAGIVVSRLGRKWRGGVSKNGAKTVPKSIAKKVSTTFKLSKSSATKEDEGRRSCPGGTDDAQDVQSWAGASNNPLYGDYNQATEQATAALSDRIVPESVNDGQNSGSPNAWVTNPEAGDAALDDVNEQLVAIGLPQTAVPISDSTNIDQDNLDLHQDTDQDPCMHDSYIHDSVMLQPPTPTASLEERLDFLHQQLDSFSKDKPAVSNLVLLGQSGEDRRQGGQGIVQMARHCRTRKEYAIKFYVSGKAFEEERGMYSPDSGSQGADLCQFLPQVFAIHSNADSKLVDAHGHALPPCIIMERGESLDIWTSRAQPDRLQACMMISHLASRVKDLHALGYVHRDLKPGNVMWLPRENRWTIIDFGCAAKTGTQARLGFSFAYAAPEVIRKYRSGSKHMIAQEAVDVWSLGVMAFELLTGTIAIRMFEGKEMAMDRIEGMHGLQLPWEGNMSVPTRNKLGKLANCILGPLSRNPADRPSMAQFCSTCNRLLAGGGSFDQEQ